jgi:hypothetical protein
MFAPASYKGKAIASGVVVAFASPAVGKQRRGRSVTRADFKSLRTEKRTREGSLTTPGIRRDRNGDWIWDRPWVRMKQAAIPPLPAGKLRRCSGRDDKRLTQAERVGEKKKEKGREACAARPTLHRSGLERLNVGSLQALGAADNLEFNGLTLIERAIAVRLNRGEMDENVLARLALDKTKALTSVKPLHCSLFFHRCVPLSIKAI